MLIFLGNKCTKMWNNTSESWHSDNGWVYSLITAAVLVSFCRYHWLEISRALFNWFYLSWFFMELLDFGWLFKKFFVKINEGANPKQKLAFSLLVEIIFYIFLNATVQESTFKMSLVDLYLGHFYILFALFCWLVFQTRSIWQWVDGLASISRCH